jgi:UDP-3-O-[3-hydroxymyristoyl] glucosamine N-acyltransferase
MQRTLRVRDIAEALGAPFEGDGEIIITGAAPVETAQPTDIAFAGGRALAEVEASSAGCVLVPSAYTNASGRTIILTEHPRTAFAAVVARLYPPEPVRAGVHPTAVIAGSASVDPSCEIGAHVVIGDDAAIGGGTRIASGCAVGKRARIGETCTLHPNVVLYSDTRIGNRVVLHSGCVLGADGFGFARVGDGHYEKFPQIGIVAIDDDVEIGANSCVDRAALGVTSIGAGTKLDNMVHIGHNCRIGRHVVIAAQTGLSGGVVVEDHAVIGGQVGIGDKARIESGAVLGSGSGILTSKIVRAGEPVWGTPARPLKQHLQQLANISRLPQLREQLAEIDRRLAVLEQKP